MSTVENIVENLPSNQKIEKGINSVRKEIHAARTAPGVDVTGHQILTDTEQVLSSAEQLLREKNEGDKLQKILKEGQKATAELQHQANILRNTGAPSIDTDRLKELAERTLETARLAGIELFSSNSFRRSLSDFLLLCYDIMSDTAVDATKGKRKGKSLLKRSDKGKTASSTSTSTTTTKTTTTQAPSAPAGSAFSLSTPPSTAAPTTTTPTTTTTATPTTTPVGGGETLKDQAKEGLESAINKGLQAAGTGQRVKLSKEQIDELVNRFIALMKNITQRERTRNVFIGMMDMFRLFEQQVAEAPVSSTGETIVNKAERSAAAIRYNKHVMKTFRLSKQLFEQFTGDNSLDPLIFHLRKVDKNIRRDRETRQYFYDLRTYIIDVLNHPELIDDAETGKRGRRLIKKGRKLNDKKIWVHLRGVLDETKTLVYNIQHDPSTRKLKHDMKRLIQDIMLDEKGNIVLKEHVLQQLRLMIVSSLIERMRLPLPTVRMEDKDMAYTLKNLVVSIRDLVPERVILENMGRLSLDLSDVRQPEVEQASNTIRLVIQSINIHLEQADIKFHRKTFPKVTDRGKLRMDIGGKGMDLVIQLQTYAGARDFFRVNYVDCDVHSLSFYLQDTRHDWLYNSVLKLLSGRIKTGMETAIENTLRNHLEQLNRMLLKQLRKAKGMNLKQLGMGEGVSTTTTNITSALKTGATFLTGGNM